MQSRRSGRNRSALAGENGLIAEDRPISFFAALAFNVMAARVLPISVKPIRSKSSSL